MPWSNQSGGGSGGPWGGGNNGGSSEGGSGGGPWGGGSRPPDLEGILRKGQSKLKTMMPGGGIGGRGIALMIAGLLGAWALTGWYRVQPNEVGINLVFGSYSGINPPGLHYNYPYPIGEVLTPAVTTTRSVLIGIPVESSRRASRQEQEESLMLTGDENIVNVNFEVQWQVDPAVPQNYVFNLVNPEGTIKAIAESAMRESIGQRNLQPVLTADRAVIEQQVKGLMQKALDDYGAGVSISLVQLRNSDPPAEAIGAFRDVQTARADNERAQNEARTEANKIVPEARGDAIRIVQEAEAYRDKTVAEARGQASRFTQVYEQYAKSPQVTRERIFLETMERVLAGKDKIIIDQPSNNGVIPYLPLDGLRPNRPQGSN